MRRTGYTVETHSNEEPHGRARSRVTTGRGAPPPRGGRPGRGRGLRAGRAGADRRRRARRRGGRPGGRRVHAGGGERPLRRRLRRGRRDRSERPARPLIDEIPAQRSTLRERDHRPWPLPGRRWLMGQTWRELLFAHWEVDPAAVRRVVPPQLPLDLRDGAAWVGVTPFRVT